MHIRTWVWALRERERITILFWKIRFSSISWISSCPFFSVSYPIINFIKCFISLVVATVFIVSLSLVHLLLINLLSCCQSNHSKDHLPNDLTFLGKAFYIFPHHHTHTPQSFIPFKFPSLRSLLLSFPLTDPKPHHLATLAFFHHGFYLPRPLHPACSLHVFSSCWMGIPSAFI